MIPSSVDQVLQLATWFLALVEFVLAFYILSLNGTRVTDAGLIHLSGLPELRQLWLLDTAVSEEGVRSLNEKLPKCGAFRKL